MSNVSKGHGFEREVKKLFTDAGWFCTRAAASQSPMDLIAYRDPARATEAETILEFAGYSSKYSKSSNIPLRFLASKRDGINLKHIYYDCVTGLYWEVCLMQCKINRRRLKK